jgi:ribA/ribD-fused uncharacterized protein
MEKKILFDEQGLKPGTPFEKGQWQKIATHSDTEIKGFFGDFRFLSNFWPAKVFLDGEEYSCSEIAYQASKFKKEDREFFKTCSAKDSIKYVEENIEKLQYREEEWIIKKVEVMRSLLVQKFDKDLNIELFEKLQSTKGKYLEETNYWGDKFWGVHKTNAKEEGEGENNLGKLLMEIRDSNV